MRTVRRPSDLGHTVRHFRKKARLSQAALGSRHNLAQVMISRLESGQPGQGVERLLDILATLDLEMVVRPRRQSGDDDLTDMFL